MDKSALLPMITTRECVNRALQKEAEATPSTHGRSENVPRLLVAMLATREDIDSTIHNERPPEKRLDMPHCYARDIKVPKSYREARGTENARLWEDSMQSECFMVC